MKLSQLFMSGFWVGLFAVFSISLLGSSKAYAYPEMVRYNYVNCTACHVSPTGGGTLTAYGRQTSRDVLSTWGEEGEERPAYFINSPEWLSLGGDYRSAYSYENTPSLEMGQLSFMQLDVEAAVQYKQFTFDASLGYQDPSQPNLWHDYVISRRHYVMYHATDEIAVRGGRFFPAFGIYTPNHSQVTRSLLNIEAPEQVGQGESYNLEFSYLGDNYNVIATGIFGRPDDTGVAGTANDTYHEYGASLVVSRAIADHYKVGLSYMYGTDSAQRRHVIGPYAILGFTQKFYLMTELDFQRATNTTAGLGDPMTSGIAQTNRLGYELIKGLNLILDQEYARLDFSQWNTLTQRYGAGVWWFPRPHLEASFEYQKRQNMGDTGFSDFMYFLWHIYI
jgi:hypothetical protein